MRVAFLLVAAVGLVTGTFISRTKTTAKVNLMKNCEDLCFEEPVMSPDEACFYSDWRRHWWSKSCVCTCSYDNWVNAGVPNKEVTTPASNGNPPVVTNLPPSSYNAPGGRCGKYYRAPDFPFQSGLCNSGMPCCSTSSWCGTSSAHCECDGCINHSLTNQNCVLEGLMKEPLDVCLAGTPIDTIVSTIDVERALDAIDVAMDEVPVFNVIWGVISAVWGPVNPVNHLEGVTQQVENAVNAEIERLEQCIDSRVTGAIITKFKSDFDALLRQADQCNSDKGVTKENCLIQLQRNFVGGLANFQGYESYLEGTPNNLDPAFAYLDILPTYQVVMIAYLATLTGNIQTRKARIARASAADKSEEECNYYSLLNQGRKDLVVLYNWVRAAEDAIGDYYTPGTSFTGGCTALDAGGFSGGQYNRTFTCGSELTAKQWRWTTKSCDSGVGSYDCTSNDYCDTSKLLKTIWADLKVTDDHTCTFQLRGEWACTGGKTTSSDVVGAKIITAATRFTNDIRDRIKYEWRPQFQKKYTYTLHKFMKSYWTDFAIQGCDLTAIPQPDLDTAWLLNPDGSNAVANGPLQGRRTGRAQTGPIADNATGTHDAASLTPSAALPVAALASVLFAAIALFSLRAKATEENYDELEDREPLAA